MPVLQPSTESHFESGQTSQQGPETEVHKGEELQPSTESHIESGQTSQQGPQTEVHKGEEWSDWISEEWDLAQKKSDGDFKRLSFDVSIFRVPNYLKEIKKEAYVPKSISLGPYHHRSERLRPMHSHKRRALQRMSKRFSDTMEKLPKDKNYGDFFSKAKNKILQRVGEIKKMYDEEIDCDEERLAKMLTLDGAFIIEIFRSFHLGGVYYEPIFKKRKINRLGHDILKDTLKLENQIPLFVLKNLLESEHNSDNNVCTDLFKMLVQYPSDKFYPFQNAMDIKTSWQNPDPVLSGFKSNYELEKFPHLLGLLHKLIVYSPQNKKVCGIKCCDAKCCSRVSELDTNEYEYTYCSKCCRVGCLMVDRNEDENQAKGRSAHETNFRIECGSIACNMILDKENNKSSWSELPRAVELTNAGIKFQPRIGGIKGITFDRNSATLYLPPIVISDYTEVLFRNLMAFEMCTEYRINYVAWYICLMDNLIDTEEDVALLRRMGIVRNLLGSDKKVADLFNGLSTGVSVGISGGIFADKMIKEVNAHYKHKFKVQCAEFVNVHFSSMWKTFAWVGAIAIFVLSLLQTIFSILSVVLKK